ncbi:MAG: HPr kinase/phosphatase C-terminal domain-containing protein [Pseudomonadota bacterium]
MNFLENIHANLFTFEGVGFLLRGPSGSGKSDLTLRVLDEGGALVSDDRTDIFADNDNKIYGQPPEALKGKLEIRGIGIITHPYTPSCFIDVICDLCNSYARMPEDNSIIFHSEAIKYYRINPFESSIIAKLRIMAQTLRESR